MCRGACLVVDYKLCFHILFLLCSKNNIRLDDRLSKTYRVGSILFRYNFAGRHSASLNCGHGVIFSTSIKFVTRADFLIPNRALVKM